VLQAPPQLPAQDSLSTYLLTGASVGGKTLDGWFDYATGPGALQNALVTAGVCFRGVRFAQDLSVVSIAVLGDSVFFYGCEADTDARLVMVGAKVNCGTGQPLRELECWGLLIGGVSWLSNGATVYGYASFALNFFEMRDPNTYVTLAGGACHRINGFVAGTLLVFGDFSVPYEIGNAGTVAIQAEGGTLDLQNTLIFGAGGIEATRGTFVFLHDSVLGVGNLGGNAVNVRGASRIICTGAPALGDAVANDWVVSGAPAFNKADLANVGDAVLGTDGSVATRAI